MVKSNSHNSLRTALYNYGSISIGLLADNLQNYKSGIFGRTTKDCPSTDANHAVNLVGYGSEAGNLYWIVQNTWSSRWGESGYFRIHRDTTESGPGACGMYSMSSFVHF